MIKTIALSTLEKALNNAISLDPASLERLRELEGHIIKVELLKLDQHFFLFFTDDGFSLRENCNGEADIIIRGAPSALFKMGMSENKTLYGSDVKIIGDMGLGEALQNIFSQIDIDWEEGIAQYTGDVAAHHIGKTLRKTRDWTKQTHENMQQNWKEYLQEEINVLPRQEEVQQFCDEVSTLRNDVERLTTRMQQR